jgi:putative two-component system response regulator
MEKMETEFIATKTISTADAIKSIKIYLVDDDPNFLLGLSRVLRKASFDVEMTTDAHQAIDEIKKILPDLILLDIDMPFMNGFEIKRELEKDPITTSIPVVFITGYDDRMHTMIGLNLAEEYIYKPIDAEILVARINALIRSMDIGYKKAVMDSRKSMFGEDYLHQWGQAVEIHDYGTAGHTERVTAMFVVFAKALGIEGKDLENSKKGAMLHDIGKLAIPEEILNKPGPLDEKEWAIMRKHPIIAYRMLMDIERLLPAVDIPLFHHERWDGTGYPCKLSGPEIPLVARIFTVVDVYDALISKRPYKKGLSSEEALTIIKEQSGSQFDPEIVDYFITHFEEIRQMTTEEHKKAQMV